MQITVVRHGETKINYLKKIQGSRTNEKLNVAGRKQIRNIANKLLKDNAVFDLVMSSPLSRALESASILNETLKIDDKIIINMLFQERDFGYFEKMDIDEFYKLKSEKDIDEYYESDDELLARINYAALDISNKYPNSNILVAAHSQVIKSLLIIAGAKGYHFQSPIKNGEFFTFEIKDHKIKFVCSSK
ncbi:phosphoglycerate mutase family protein [Acholeplasma sp. OttesenSCG-928-E16]|nr:phosphoglycerate mutase family protein [Acholeplasma sp. OttesenSCG-928-E16]